MSPAPLLVVCALGPEVWALRGGDWTGAVGGSPVLARTGMGRARARRSVANLLARDGYGALVVAGFGAAVGPGVRPGDVIVADAVRDGEGGHHPLDSAAPLADALRACGLTTRLGLHHTADHVVRGFERRALYAQGALAVDMEAAAVLAARAELRPALPTAVLRVVVDTPERELLRPGTLPAGLHAWRALRAAVPALVAWHRHAVSVPSVTPFTASAPEPQPSTLPQEAS
ncbi:1-hydroxy-2-methyl-2-butenyl 4-diphosphate reductase [Kitasatospora sp. MAP5-34]|uniref:phosphorylase family protein n=1 Tax=Kitasatospora sp. MAP5-34 TaxID=3035102 RepID=UPI002474673C|nr:1-hydroxy-2-methyl-2-butenyl 4-diphosphate reductase [Kitasatospora sp. MAP5-34]MDH6579707.1 nucleoside phosphorylase [Kitasatospora sp. MAP5-34]